MMNTDSSVNDVRLVGKRASGFRFSHRAWGTDYYMTDFAAERLSGMRDWILVRVSEKQCETLSQNQMVLYRPFSWLHTRALNLRLLSISPMGSVPASPPQAQPQAVEAIFLSV